MKTRHAIRFIITEWKSTESNRIRFVQPTYDNNDGIGRIRAILEAGEKEREEAEKVERLTLRAPLNGPFP